MTRSEADNAPSILFINQHYWPDLASTAQHLTDLAEYLADQGVDVHVLCSRGHYLSGSMEVPAEETHNGVHIHRVRATAFGRDTILGRITDYASFYSSTLARVLAGPAYDYIVTLTTPPLLPLVGTIARRVRGQAYGIWSMDLHPDAEVATGMLEDDGVPARLLHALNDAGYRNADFVVDLGAYMKRRIRRKNVPDDRLHTIPVWNKKEEIAPIEHDENPLRSELGLDDTFVVMYSGNAGRAHRFEEVLATMKRLDGHPDIEFVFVGEGPQKDRIQAFAERHALSNFRYLPYFPREDLRYSLPMADVHLMTLREEMAGIAVPGKLYGIMAAGRPALMVGPEASESGETIQNANAGRVVDPVQDTDPTQKLHDILMSLYRDDALRTELGQNGREAFLEHFEREVCCRKWASLFGSRLNGGSEVGASSQKEAVVGS
ncbi:glycosyltransferase involved in cell wall biosynthesis [Salinibacter ruber]|uniref:glycosyltransferase family 4 protein n=1 Tax=Salinibacter ruber TaxID=146919 RepID=UPI001ABBDA34|nr:glycosyltransferase family 4 protein [Salinibacter ruber]MCS3650104.1 glycosyltransferase involved in cell wall biosynthesis [Salinibacter ruber]MCS3653358.1 glycosyltransferase involved in cell wall biosynthesis [Salinibacter ruber]